MRRLGGPTLLYALVAVFALAAPIAVSEEAPAPAEPAGAGQAAAAPPSGTVSADSPAALGDSAAAPAAPAEPSPAQPGAAQPGAAQPGAAPPASSAAPADPAAASSAAAAQPVLKDDGPADKPKRHVIALAAASSAVNISDFKFSPSGVTVNVGDTVTWSNSGPTPHSATANDGSFDTGILQKGASGSHTFTQAGTFSYFCKPHPFMKGTITVAAAAADNSGGSGGDTGGGSTGDTSATGSEADTGSGLPSTGLDVGGIAVMGLMTLALGAYLRRRTAVAPARPAGRIGW